MNSGECSSGIGVRHCPSEDREGCLCHTVLVQGSELGVLSPDDADNCGAGGARPSTGHAIAEELQFGVDAWCATRQVLASHAFDEFPDLPGG